MYVAIKGIYENGKITFTEEPPVKSKAEVAITFLTGQEQDEAKSLKRKVTVGLLEGKIKLPDDFKEPLNDLNDINTTNQGYPSVYAPILADTERLGFTMPSDILTCTLLRTLAASKPAGKFLELGTGSGLATSWILDGMDARSSLVSIDHDDALLGIARTHLGHDGRLSLALTDGADWVAANADGSFDYIFADTWHGKYLLLDEVLAMLRPGGLYIIDDMLAQPNWPEGHHEKAIALIQALENRSDLWVVKQHWASGIIVCTRR